MEFNDLKRLIEAGEQESMYLEFKRGDALDAQNDKKAEFIKDVTAFANAAGGRLIYGLAEKKVDGIGVADSFAPVTKQSITKDWVSSVIADKTGPRFTDFDVQEIAIEGGRAIVIDIKAAATAHQNLFDCKYYQRVGVVTSALTDFQIRDLMSRRTRPLARVDVSCRPIEMGSSLHRYHLAVALENIGLVTMEKWWIDLVVPATALRDTRNGPDRSYSFMNSHHLFSKMVRNIKDARGSEAKVKICFGDPFVDGRRFILHPGQIHSFDPGDAQIPQFIIEIDDENYRSLAEGAVTIEWTLFCNNAPPVYGHVDFDDWCKY